MSSFNPLAGMKKVPFRFEWKDDPNVDSVTVDPIGNGEITPMHKETKEDGSIIWVATVDLYIATQRFIFVVNGKRRLSSHYDMQPRSDKHVIHAEDFAKQGFYP
ncbi:hypothetical protein PROFUN_02704 [Planoprotostelium fungivorum]|uniref:Uncharacterized protein n=1 Tax=Planoprotostelium fungivorum TaxID=1890364 RepID=A0A2P6NVG6_9EUKA|nr:hypothetical protein PROFUN_02704 [Planoprotostelium fungivorum]